MSSDDGATGRGDAAREAGRDDAGRHDGSMPTDGGDGAVSSAAVTVVPTFESAGLYFDSADDTTPVTVRYRESGGSWMAAVGMDYITNEEQYRSSIVYLAAGTDYVAEITQGDATHLQSFSTWPETSTLPIGPTTTLSGPDTTITTGGSPSGYHLVDASGTIEGGTSCVVIDASYVIVRGVTCHGQSGGIAAIRVTNGQTDVIIEDSEIREWGAGPENWHGNAVFIGAGRSGSLDGVTTNERIVVQRTWMHDPDWGLTPDTYDSSRGARGISLTQAERGNHVFRYNTITGNETHFLGDAIGGSRNFNYYGFPGPDTDIYGNYLTHCTDDCIEVEGGGVNVRVGHNYIAHFGVAIAAATTTRGPLYVYRNVLGPTRGLGGGDKSGAFKVGGRRDCENCDYPQPDGWNGRQHLYHNSFLNVPGLDGSSMTAGTHWGGHTVAMTSRNNIVQTRDGRRPFEDQNPCHWVSGPEQANDFDYDLYWDRADLFECGEQEPNGIRSEPTFAMHTVEPGPGDPARFELQADTPGHDDGVLIPNFSEGFLGAAPDMGAHEAGAPAMCFGHGCPHD